MAIHNWPKEEQPREKLLRQGAQALSDAELLTLFIRTGTKEQSALDIARALLREHGSLTTLLNASQSDLCRQHGLGAVKFAGLKAAVELGRRFILDAPKLGEKITSTTLAKQFFIHRLQHYPQEVFACLFLNARQQIICFEELFFGTINEANVYPREIVKRGLTHNAAKLIFGHNHPSGDATPSQQDQDLTQLLVRTLAVIDIQVVDHIIVGNPGATSMADLSMV